MSTIILGSLARIADFDTEPFEFQTLDPTNWSSGDFVIGEITGVRSELYRIECTTGEMISGIAPPRSRVRAAIRISTTAACMR
jgi:hypothetical protein